MDQTFTTSDGATIAFTPAASTKVDVPRVALIHSLALDRSIWDRVAATLQRSAAILTYDCRGHGRSGRGTAEFTPELFARDLAELLDHVGWQSVTVVGCSMGGCVAIAFAGLYPARASGLVLIDTTAGYGVDALPQWRERGAAARANGMSGLIDFQLKRWFSDQFLEQHPQLVERTVRVFNANDVESYAASCTLLGNADLRPYLPSLRVPVAVIVGEQDFATPLRMSRELHEAIPQSTLTVLPGARHLTPIECPDAIASELRRLLFRQELA